METNEHEYRPMLAELAAHRRRLGDCGGGTALALCLEAIKLMEQRADVLDYGGRRRVLAAVAELLELQLPGPGVHPGGEAWRDHMARTGQVYEVWGDPPRGA
jgi:hypothetical protein